MSRRKKKRKGNFVKLPKPPLSALEQSNLVNWNVFNSVVSGNGPQRPRQKRSFTTGLIYSPDVLSFPRLENLRLSTRHFRMFLILKYVFGTGEWLTVAQWDFASRLLESSVVPRSFLDRSGTPTPGELASEESLLTQAVLARCLYVCPPGTVPDSEDRQNLLDYLLFATAYDTAHYRGKYFALSNEYGVVLSKVLYRGKWLRSGRKRSRVKSPSAVGSGKSESLSPWRRTPRHLLLPKDGGRPDRDTVEIDPLTLLPEIQSSIRDLALLKLNKGAFF